MDFKKSRILRINDESTNPGGDYVVYWMIAHRRPTYNFALQRARDRALQFDRPLVIVEALRHGYPWASDRLHTFILQGMAANQRALQSQCATYYPFVETAQHSGHGLLKTLSQRACVVVTDCFPAFFLPRMVEAAGKKISVHLEAVDSNGILPIYETDHLFKRAYDFRRYLHDSFLEGELDWPQASPLQDHDLGPPPDLPATFEENWPRASQHWLEPTEVALRKLPIDHDVAPNRELPGGCAAAGDRLNQFLDSSIDDYHERRNELTAAAESGLSPYLHFGHISAHRIFDEIRKRRDWQRSDLDEKRRAKREGFWGLAAGPEAYLDQLLTWRELGFNRCALDPEGYSDYETLPQWAKKTLAEHADDRRPHVYDLDSFEAAKTHDELWNAAQNQLVETGTMHNYLRMLWGKKILHWSDSPQEALEIMIELNNKYALDGRDPNSYNGIFWVLGRFDRAWGPERSVFGKIRYMTTAGARRKFDVQQFLQRFQ